MFKESTEIFGSSVAITSEKKMNPDILDINDDNF